MRFLPLIPAVLTAMIVGLIAATHPLHAHEMMLACEITGGITFAAAVAIVAAKKCSPTTIFQVALGATAGQMMLTGMAAVIIWVAHAAANFQSFALWLLAFYWLGLFILTPIAIKIIRSAAPQNHQPAVKVL